MPSSAAIAPATRPNPGPVAPGVELSVSSVGVSVWLSSEFSGGVSSGVGVESSSGVWSSFGV